MPAAAVIPAPIAYIKVVAVKKLVVEFWTGWAGLPRRCVLACAGPFLLVNCCVLYWVWQGTRTFTLKKLECLKQAYA